jgi:hypothetical protein
MYRHLEFVLSCPDLPAGVGLTPHASQTQIQLTHARTLLAQGYDVGYVNRISWGNPVS